MTGVTVDEAYLPRTGNSLGVMRLSLAVLVIVGHH